MECSSDLGYEGILSSLGKESHIKSLFPLVREGKKKVVTLIEEEKPALGTAHCGPMAVKGKERGHHLSPDPADVKEGIPAHTGKHPAPSAIQSDI